MTNCNIKDLKFPRIKNKELKIDFSGGNISSDGGLIPVHLLDKKLGIISDISNAVKSFDIRNKSKIKHKVSEMLRQRIYGIISGSACREVCVEISKVFVEKFIDSFKTPPKELVLDFDATDDEIHGNQEGRFFHGYYDHYCFLPLYVFCGDQLLVPYLRPSNIDGAKHSRAILDLLVKRFRKQWPGVKIIFRGDGGFCRWPMLSWCERNNVQYIVGISSNAKLEKLTTHIAVKSEHTDKGKNLRCIVTNMKGIPKYLYEKIYCMRGDMENRIKEQQLDLFADRTSCHGWWANQFRLLLASAAYILM